MQFRLLIVDDENTIRKSLTKAIPWHFYDCIVHAAVSDGREAVKILEAQSVDIVITDIRMPLMDGISLAKYIYENHFATKVIILTGYADFKYAQAAIQYSVSSFILKPVAHDKLICAIKKAQNDIRDIFKNSGTSMEKQINTGLISDDENLRVLPIIRNVMQIIDQEYGHNIGVEYMAKKLYLSPNYLGQIVIRYTGKTINDHILKKRITVSEDLLTSTNIKINKISAMSGFSSSSYFIKKFKESTGLSPVQYRIAGGTAEKTK